MNNPFDGLVAFCVRRILLLALLTGICGLTACQTKPKGPLWTGPEMAPAGKARVYIYRAPSERLGYKRNYFITANGRSLPDIVHGGYLVCDTDAGELRLISTVHRQARTLSTGGAINIEAMLEEGPGKIEMEAVAGETYYVKMVPIAHAFHFEPMLLLMSRAEAEPEIARCSLITAD